MSSESLGVGANEFPDRVSVAQPENPLLATFRPYIPADVHVRELTVLPLIIGTVLGMIFGASSLWLVLKVGLTVSASIPVAVISISLFRLLGKIGVRDATILENNIVQTAGSAGESIAFGVGVTMPAIMILGFDLEFTRVMLVAVMGGLLGILMMIPLRRALIVQQHGLLKYPEGTACAEVLKAGASEESRAAADPMYRTKAVDTEEASSGAKTIFTGFGIGLIYQVAMAALKGWKDVPSKVFGAPFKAGSLAAEISPALLGVGYIIGPRIASIMCAGGVLAYLVLIPAIKFFGEGMTTALPPGTVPISEMEPDAIRGAYVLYIGAGAVAAGGIISLFRSLPTIWHGLKGGLRDLRGGPAGASNLPRTDQDLSMKVVVGGVLVLIAMIMILPQLHLQFNLLGAVLIIAFGFLFVTVSSRLTGEIGSSSNPISGMTVATLLLTCLIFLIVGWTGPSYYVTALSIGGIVCIAASNGGTTSQDLKTGFLVGATPKYQQIAILIGALASALILGPILLRLNDQSTVYVPQTTFRAVRDAQQLDPAAAAALPAFTDPVQPPGGGSYRLLRSEAGAAPVAGLEPGEYLVDGSGKLVQRVERNFPATLRADTSNLGPPEKVKGVGLVVPDNNEYATWHKVDERNGPPGKYLVDSQGVPQYYVDPGINGTHRTAPDGSSVSKYDAPKATLMSYIIKGILNQQLPWGLVLLGVMISIVLEMAGIPSLAFAVGVYLPLSSSSPIFLGGMIRWLVDKYLRVKLRTRELTEEEFVAETDKSPGVLMASGYIAGGALAAVFIAFFAGLWKDQSDRIEHWARDHNPFFAGPWADLLSLLPFLVLMIILYLVGREVLLAPKRRRT
ncbi:MAG TPA: oligopeptide transporter, OPT family [Pyrinomonadaceae bacterium]|nr:oligopeptide transporter, OPT family [Pyrinomonadaceae bacterium]